MWQYNYSSGNSMSHGIEWKKHKYYTKVKLGPKKYRYFYTMAAYKAYLSQQKKLKEKSESSDTDASDDKIGSFLSKFFNKNDSTTKNQKFNLTKSISSFISGISKKTVSSVLSYAETGKKFLKSTVAYNSKKKHEYAKSSYFNAIQKGKSFVKNSISSISKTFNTEKKESVISKGKEYVSKTSGYITSVIYGESKTKKISRSDYGYDEYHPVGEKPTSLSDTKKKEKKWYNKIEHIFDSEKDVDQDYVNPCYYKSYLDGDQLYTNNCAYCTATYDLRRRGYDVEADYYSPETYKVTRRVISSWYKESATDKVGWSRVESSQRNWPGGKEAVIQMSYYLMDNVPNESYGYFDVDWTSGAGHSMVWERENNKIIIRDCQTHKKYTPKTFAEEYGDMIEGVYTLRTDNMTLDDSILEAVVERK